MAEREQEQGQPVRHVKAIHIIVESTQGEAIRMTLSPEVTLYQILTLASPGITERSVEKLLDQPARTIVAAPPPSPEAAADAPKEREPPITVTGRLKSKPRQGRPDSKGKPTAWAPLAVHEEGSEQAKMYSATFHRHTAAIALGLPEGAQLTVQGYARPSNDPQRMDSLSVFNIPTHPGKPQESQEG